MKWEVPTADQQDKGHHLGRRCTKCKDSDGSPHKCECEEAKCTGTECPCAKEGKCCKCCCNDGCGCKKECSCVEKEDVGTNNRGHRIYNDSYQSAYGEMSFPYIGEEGYYLIKSVWTDLQERGGSKTPSQRRHQCARILLGSVCLIWSGITYMYWTGKYTGGSPYWNNHILDGSSLDDGTLSQWLQALGFPRDMLNNGGPRNRLDKVIWNGFRDTLYLGFPDTSSYSGGHGVDKDVNTFRDPSSMNFAGYIHTLEKGAFDKEGPFKENSSVTDQHKRGAIFKLYILSCAYFTGLQKKTTSHSTISVTNTPKTIREILYWLSALPYSPAYKKMLGYAKERIQEVLKKPGDSDSSASNQETQLKFYQDKRTHPITVHEYNLFAHFQAVTQYCPLVLIGIQGGLHSTDKTTEPPIHSLYANTACGFTYPTVKIQAYNQVVHYIRALFYQLYFLRKQCAVKVTCGGKWRECRYGSGVLGKGVVSWMCMGCDPMEHDRNYRVENMGKILDGVKGGVDSVPGALKDLLGKIGEVVVQLGNAQEALEGKAEKGAIEGVIKTLEAAKEGLDTAVSGNGLKDKLKEAKAKLDDLTTNGGGKLKDAYWLTESRGALEKLTGKNGGNNGILKDLETKVGGVVGHGGLDKAKNGKDVDPGKNKISEAINGVHDVLDALKKVVEGLKHKKLLNKESFSHVLPLEVSLNEENILGDVIKELISICSSPKCPGCTKHNDKCGQKGNPIMCTKCGSMTTTGFPSPSKLSYRIGYQVLVVKRW